MKRFISLATLLIAYSTGVSAGDSTTVYYETLSIDLSAGGASANAASMTGFGVSGTTSITENAFIAAAYTRLTGDIVGFASSTSMTQFGIGYTLHDDVNLKAGTGSQLRTGVSYYSAILTAKIGGTEYSESDKGTMIGLNYNIALGEAIFVDASLSGPLKDFKATFGIAGSYKVGPGNIRLGYSANENTISGVTLKGSGYQLGYTFNY